MIISTKEISETINWYSAENPPRRPTVNTASSTYLVFIDGGEWYYSTTASYDFNKKCWDAYGTNISYWAEMPTLNRKQWYENSKN